MSGVFSVGSTVEMTKQEESTIPNQKTTKSKNNFHWEGKSKKDGIDWTDLTPPVVFNMENPNEPWKMPLYWWSTDIRIHYGF